jgi:hypothetical protein
MIEIIKEGTKRNVVCPNCEAELRYDIRKDVVETKYNEAFTNQKQLKIACPCCNRDIVLEATR